MPRSCGAVDYLPTAWTIFLRGRLTVSCRNETLELAERGLIGRFKFFQRVPDFGSLFVILAFDGLSEVPFELFAPRQRAFAVDLFEPVLQGLDLSALRHEIVP